MKIKGITVQLEVAIQTSTDPFGGSIENIELKDIENVLVTPSSTDDVTTTFNLTGKLSKYTLCIPKGDTNNWTDTYVHFFNRKWRTIGSPMEYIEDMVPLKWNKKVMVEAYE